MSGTATIFDLLEAVTADAPEGSPAWRLKGGYARKTGGLDMDFIISNLRKALSSKGKSKCGLSTKMDHSFYLVLRKQIAIGIFKAVHHYEPTVTEWPKYIKEAEAIIARTKVSCSIA